MTRIPLPPYPNGWFALCYSSDVKPGELKSVHRLGQDFIVARGEDGKAGIFDAYCPHLGAHIGKGGKVCGNKVQCPFHGWVFDIADGKCSEIPYAKKVPPKAGLETWPTLEQNDIVYVYHHNERKAPEWEPDLIPELENPDYKVHDRKEWTIRSHPQEVMENGVDYAHFLTLHKWDTVDMRWVPDGVRYKLEIDVDTESEKQAATAANAVNVNSYNSGPGFLFTRVTGAMRGIAMNMLTPIDPEVLLVEHAYYAHKDVDPEIAKGFFDAYQADWGLDFPIWDNKIHRARPILTEVEGDVGRFRRWYKQFYPEPSGASAE